MKTFNIRMRFTALIILLTLAATGRVSALLAQANLLSDTETIVINAPAPANRFPHSWEKMFGSRHAVLALRQSCRRDLKAVRRVTDFQYVRFHGIFDRDVGLYSEDKQGRPKYNFTNVDQIYDGLLANGIRPFVELSFMPEALASRPKRQVFSIIPTLRRRKTGTAGVNSSALSRGTRLHVMVSMRFHRSISKSGTSRA